jgi:hypothetical protein
VAGLTATTVTCACAAGALPLLLAVRFAALPRAGANVFGAVMPILEPRSVALEWPFFLLLLALLGAGLLFMAVGAALDARGRSTFLKRFLATPEGAVVNALCAVTQKKGADGGMIVDRFKPPARRASSKVYPVARSGGGGGGGGGGGAEWAVSVAAGRRRAGKRAEARRARGVAAAATTTTSSSSSRSRSYSGSSSSSGSSGSGSSSDGGGEEALAHDAAEALGDAGADLGLL